MRKLLAVLLSLLFAASVAACSDDGDGGSGSDSETTTTTDGDAAAGADDDEPGDDDDPADDDATTTTEGSGGDDDDPVVAGDFCEQAQIFASDTSLGELDFTDPDDIAIGVGLLEDFRDAAPAEIQDDLQIIIDGFQRVAQAMAEAGDDPEAQQAVAEELAADLQALQAASAEVQTYTQEECGIDITGGGTGATPEG